MRLADDDKLDEVVNLWCVQKRTQDMPISVPILCEKAAQLHALLHKGDSEPPFQPSRDWLWQFCQHHGLWQLCTTHVGDEMLAASHIQQIHFSSNALVPCMTDDWGSTVEVNDETGTIC